MICIVSNLLTTLFSDRIILFKGQMTLVPKYTGKESNMVLQRFDPFTEIRRAEDVFNRLWQNNRASGFDSENWAIPLDVVQAGNDMVVKASLPGVDADGISVTLEDGLLTIEAETSAESKKSGSDYLLRERRFGRFHRSLRLPGSVDADKAQPTYENGVLTITIPKEQASKARRLEIKSG